MLPIYVVNNHGQFNHLILRMLRDLGIDAKMIPNEYRPENISNECRGLVLGGGPSLEKAGRCAEYLELGLPVLGICLGLHVIATTFGGTVTPGRSGGYGAVAIEICNHDEVLAGYPDRIQVWASHADEVAVMPEGAMLLARSAICSVEALSFPGEQIYGLQWHPEVSHTENGSLVYKNFDHITRKSA
jgi:GMP synthase (glutamine-hydrolysing)